MPYQEDFAVEQFMDKYETSIVHNMGETCCYSLNLDEVYQLTGEKFSFDGTVRLTYGSIKGSEELRSLVAAMYSNESIKLTKDNVLITNGAIGANFLVNYTLVGPNDHVICVDPTYQQLNSVPKMFGADVDLLELKREDGWTPNLSNLEDLIKPNTKLVVINNPNNPLGSVIPTEQLKKVAALCKRHGIYVLSDEVYAPLFHSCSPPQSFCQLYSRGIITGSMSKAYSAAGLRLGWIVSQDVQLLKDAASRRDYNTISVSQVDDHIACYMLRNRKAILERNLKLCKENLETLESFVASSEGRFSFVVKPLGGAVCLVSVNGIEDTEKFCASLAEDYKVLCVPGEVFGRPGSIRIGYGNSAKDLENALPILQQAYDEWTIKVKISSL